MSSVTYKKQNGFRKNELGFINNIVTKVCNEYCSIKLIAKEIKNRLNSTDFEEYMVFVVKGKYTCASESSVNTAILTFEELNIIIIKIKSLI